MHELGPKLVRAFEMTEWLTFVGHTHYPGVFTEDARFLVPKEVGYRYRLVPGEKAIINVGSVGQPRDGDPRLAYALWDGETVRWRRLEYDVETAARRIREAGLPESLADRLSAGR